MTTQHAYPQGQPLPSPAAGGLQTTPGPGSSSSNNNNNSASNSANNTNNDFAAGVTPPVTHKRSYQACIPCRRRKVRCDLGSVEAPHSPPCVRCRRESKECFFSATRRRGPGELAGSGGDDEGPSRKKVKEDTPKRQVVGPSVLPTTLPTKPGAQGHGRAQSVSSTGEFVSRPRQRPNGRNSLTEPSDYFDGQEPDSNIDPALAAQSYEDPTQAVTNSASTLLNTEVYNTPDALALLFEAVGRSSHISPVNHPTASTSSAGARRSLDRKNSSSSVNVGSPTLAEPGNMRPPPPKSSTSSCDSRGVRFQQDGSVSPKVNRNHINNLSIHSKRNRRLTGRELSPSRSRVLLADENEIPESILDPALLNQIHDSDAEENPLGPDVEVNDGPMPQSPTSAHPSTTSSKTKEYDPFTMFPADAITLSLRAWSKYRFVIAGWFTAKEALIYMTYFYNHMAPMSPIFTGYFSHPATHEELVTTEPVLATTLLTLASRYCLLPGAGGLSRSYAIHDKLWRNLQSLFQRLMWGSEKRMRTMGTVLALVALTEWHCRGLHFPGEDDGEYAGLGGFGLPEDKLDNDDDFDGVSSTANKYVVEGLGDSIGNLLEPAYRSDRMSWMLLGNSLALAYELGVFDENDEDSASRPFGSGVESGHPSASKLVAKPSTATVQRILVISVMHLASRLGWTSMIPRHISVTVLFRGQQRSPFLQQQLQSGSQEPVDADEPPSLTATPVQDLVLQSWVELTSLMKSASELLFPSRKATKTVLRNGKYTQLLEHFQPLLRSWRRDFDNLTIDEPMRSIMRVEFEYLRLYVNSLALQAVVDRCTNTNLNPNNLNGSKKSKDAATPLDLNSNPTITPATFQAPPPVMSSNPGYATLMQICAGDEEYIKEVVDASRCLLLTVIRKLLPGGWLKHAPVRTYLRIASAAMYLLKTFALGAKEDDIKVSLKLMDQTVYALRAASCDDVHLALRFGDLLETLTARIRSRFIRMNQSGKDTPNKLNHGESNQDQPMLDVSATGTANTTSNGATEADSLGMPHAHIVYGNSVFPNDQQQHQYQNGFNVQQQFPTYSNVFPTSFHALGDTGNFTNLANMYGVSDNEMDGLFNGTNGGGDDWLTLPIEPLLASYGAGVSNGMMGPDVGGQDLLELLLAEES